MIIGVLAEILSTAATAVDFNSSAREINGRLTFPANLHGNPAISIPAGFVDRLPIGLQMVGRHFAEERLLDLALTAERERPWPLTVRPGT